MSETEDHNPELYNNKVYGSGSYETHSESGDCWIGLNEWGWVVVWENRQVAIRKTRMQARQLIRRFKENPGLADIVEVHES